MQLNEERGFRVALPEYVYVWQLGAGVFRACSCVQLINNFIVGRKWVPIKYYNIRMMKNLKIFSHMQKKVLKY